MKKSLYFIKSILRIATPIIIAQLLLNVASLLDNVMVGQLDDNNVSGVYIATQIIFVVNLMIFGSIEGASVYFCQFYGSKDKDNMKKSILFKFYSSLIISLLATIILQIFGRNFVEIFPSTDIAHDIAENYLKIVSFSFIPFAITVCLTSTLRETHHTIIPMVITGVGVIINFCVNYCFIYGKFGAPEMGAAGAAIGTITERIFEFLSIIILYLIKKYDFIKGIFKDLRINKKLLIQMIRKSIPLFINETMWVLGQTMLTYVFSKSSDISTVALPIANTIFNLLFVVCLGLGNSISILIGNTVGENNKIKAQNEAKTAIIFSTLVGIMLGIILCLISPIIISLYTGISQEAKDAAQILIIFFGIYFFICSLNNSLFFTIRSGGKTLLVFLFDSAYGWVVQIPLAFLFTFVFKLDFVILVMVVNSVDIIKTIVGLIIVLSKRWFKNLTQVHKNSSEIQEIA